ncbi:hypothetical protein NEOLI_001468 [Neolecta irregularis DAH-3]|uniref:Uncharacterized protein n=1 Tax=Neolecta irregularis (strain DAH-3) TaxID=1198029 RepID=A0A1U7LUI7_NEOID|nr:hypothetical protein NEOLI_001468 [Neolecta irregularis DAH-3]|eukprot:OLL26289.1 hypothetical protein NEOLI_001468 [Neolecta irregularis DAH-3]
MNTNQLSNRSGVANIFSSMSNNTGSGPVVFGSIITVLILIFFCLTYLVALKIVKKRQQARQRSLLPVTERHSIFSFIHARSSMQQGLLVPEIQITFPDEEDADERRYTPGRVVVVQVGESGAAFVAPIQSSSPPAYGQFDTVDIESIGGLKEKGYS